MSIIVKNMGMPERCGMCFLRVGDCKQRIYMEQRPKACPLIEIPTPHGRLVDLDALIEKYGEWYTEEGPESGYIGTMKNLLENASTIIEAEGET